LQFKGYLIKKGKLTMEHMLSKALREFMSGPLNQLVVNLGGEDGAMWEEELKRFNRKETCWPKGNPYLSRIATGNLKATDGKRTIVEAKGMFSGGFDSDYVGWGTDVPGQPKEEMPFEVLELIKNGKFAEIFEAFGQSLDRLCWEQDQILDFVENHPDKLHPKGWATFFLFKVGDEFFVAYVYRFDDGQLLAYVYRLSYDYVWDAGYRYRFVVPQLPLVA
jgi:hypothetical protein